MFVCKYGCGKTKPLFEPFVIPKVETETIEEK
jgi:hypothetical protein